MIAVVDVSVSREEKRFYIISFSKENMCTYGVFFVYVEYSQRNAPGGIWNKSYFSLQEPWIYKKPS